MTPTRPLARARLGRLPWLLPAALVAHVAEEWPDFPVWATGHFGTTTASWFVVSHVPIVALVAWIAARASRSNATSRDLRNLALAIAAFATNAVFHLAATVVFGEYAPGVVTATLFYLPLAALLMPRIAMLIGRRATAIAAGMGFALSMLVTASLLLEVAWP